MSQRSRILELLKSSPDRTVTCGYLAQLGLYHSAAKRVHEANKEGFDIRWEGSDTWASARYRLIKEPVTYKEEPNGQMIAFG